MRKSMLVGALAMSVGFADVASYANVRVPEGTEFLVRIEDSLSSKTSTPGDRFTITLMEDVPLGDGTVLRAGYRGQGEVTMAEQSGRVGKKGQLSVSMNYLRVGDERIKLRASKGAAGSGNTGNMVAAIFLGGVFGLLVKGKNATMNKVQMTAYADADADLSSPLPSPPPET